MKRFLCVILCLCSTLAFAGEYQCNNRGVHYLDYQSRGANCDTLSCLEDVLPLVRDARIESVKCVSSESGNTQFPTVYFSDMSKRGRTSTVGGEYVCFEDALHFLDSGNCSTVKCVERFKASVRSSSIRKLSVVNLSSRCEISRSGNWKYPVVRYTIRI